MKIIISVICALALFLNSSAQDSLSNDILVNKIDSVERELNQIKRNTDSVLMVAALSKEYIHSADNLDVRLFNRLTFFLGIIALLFTGGLFGFYYQTKLKYEQSVKELKDAAQAKLEEKTTELRKANEAEVREILTIKDRDDYLLKTRKVLVLYKTGVAPQKYFTNVIQNFNIEEFDLRSLSEMPSFDDIIADYAALVVYNESDSVWKTTPEEPWGEMGSDNRSTEHQALIDFIDNSPPKTGVFYFGSVLHEKAINNPEQRNLISFSNIPSQVFNNLLRLLDLQERLENDKLI